MPEEMKPCRGPGCDCPWHKRQENKLASQHRRGDIVVARAVKDAVRVQRVDEMENPAHSAWRRHNHQGLAYVERYTRSLYASAMEGVWR